jgi:predicted metal-dependent HD superfamily phosphohydrolase
MRSDNEEVSADLARAELVSIGLKETKINAIFELILATKTHALSGSSPDCALFWMWICRS